MILDRHYIQDHSNKLLNVYPSMCLHTLPKLPLLPQFRILFFPKSEMAHIEPLLKKTAVFFRESVPQGGDGDLPE